MSNLPYIIIVCVCCERLPHSVYMLHGGDPTFDSINSWTWLPWLHFPSLECRLVCMCACPKLNVFPYLTPNTHAHLTRAPCLCGHQRSPYQKLCSTSSMHVKLIKCECRKWHIEPSRTLSKPRTFAGWIELHVGSSHLLLDSKSMYNEEHYISLGNWKLVTSTMQRTVCNTDWGG